jgi:hypothetical protein
MKKPLFLNPFQRKEKARFQSKFWLRSWDQIQGLNLLGAVIILTLQAGCSEMPFVKDHLDPIADAATQIRKIDSSKKLSSGILGPGRPDPNPVDLAKAIQKGIFDGDLVPGMSSNDVAQAWGKPHEILYAGDPGIRNEKWIYTDHPARDGKILPLKIVYFEAGRVSGWETSFEISDPVSGPGPIPKQESGP